MSHPLLDASGQLLPLDLTDPSDPALDAFAHAFEMAERNGIEAPSGDPASAGAFGTGRPFVQPHSIPLSLEKMSYGRPIPQPESPPKSSSSSSISSASTPAAQAQQSWLPFHPSQFFAFSKIKWKKIKEYSDEIGIAASGASDRLLSAEELDRLYDLCQKLCQDIKELKEWSAILFKPHGGGGGRCPACPPIPAPLTPTASTPASVPAPVAATSATAPYALHPPLSVPAPAGKLSPTPTAAAVGLSSAAFLASLPPGCTIERTPSAPAALGRPPAPASAPAAAAAPPVPSSPAPKPSPVSQPQSQPVPACAMPAPMPLQMPHTGSLMPAGAGKGGGAARLRSLLRPEEMLLPLSPQIALEMPLERTRSLPAAGAGGTGGAAEDEEAATSRRRSRQRTSQKKGIQCQQCGARDTPEWRRGPGGPNTLCNACGMKYAKQLRREREREREPAQVQFQVQLQPVRDTDAVPSPHNHPHVPPF